MSGLVRAFVGINQASIEDYLFVQGADWSLDIDRDLYPRSRPDRQSILGI